MKKRNMGVHPISIKRLEFETTLPISCAVLAKDRLCILCSMFTNKDTVSILALCISSCILIQKLDICYRKSNVYSFK